MPPLMIINWFASAGLFLELVSSTSLFTRIMTWLADATNGVELVVARVFKGEELCLGETCITETELKAMLAGAAAGATAGDGQLLEAPAATSAQQIPHRADTATTTTPPDISTTVVEGISPVRDATSSPETPPQTTTTPSLPKREHRKRRRRHPNPHQW